jgi:hypothetical protein
MLERRLLNRRRAKQVAETIQTNLFRDVKLEQDVDRAREGKRLERGLDWGRHPVRIVLLLCQWQKAG